MELVKVTRLNDIQQGDLIVITGDEFDNKPVKAEIVKISTDSVEIIFDVCKNKYFNVGMYLKGTSWVKDVKIFKKESESIEKIKQKATKWDQLHKDMSEVFYRDTDEGLLSLLGEVACNHLGFYG